MKITKEQQQKGIEFLGGLVKKAQNNLEFKRELIKNPKVKIEEYSKESFKIPKGLDVIVEDQTDKSFVYLNIPTKPDFSNIELTDEQLEIVAGGEIGLGGWLVISAVVLLAGVGTGYALG